MAGCVFLFDYKVLVQNVWMETAMTSIRLCFISTYIYGVQKYVDYNIYIGEW